MPYEAQERKGGGQERTATLQLVIALSRAFQALERAVRPHLAEHGLGLTEFAVLEVLYHKGALHLGEIRDRILVTGASTTYVVKKLEDRGLVRRRTCAEDQRIVFGELTPKGRALIDEVFPVHVERLRKVTAGLSVAQKREASQLLRQVGLTVGDISYAGANAVADASAAVSAQVPPAGSQAAAGSRVNITVGRAP